MKIFIGADHAGYELKETIKTYLSGLNLGYEVVDKGAHEFNADDDYPDFIRDVATAVANDPEDEGRMGIVIGGSGQGEAMCANRVPGARAAVFYGEAVPKQTIDVKGSESTDPYEIIKLTRMHNDANILSLAVRFITLDQAKFAVELFLNTKFSGDERHVRRIKKLG